MRPVPKRLRHHRILELVSREPLATQEDLVKRLAREGLHITQATLSRDIRELGLVKTADGYAVPGEAEAGSDLPSLAH
ncbi:MAG TPA: ArgR family transcriptional regulator, partial [Terriglobales bacterium]|nr:ArgR family transcriptional regulator [Terriglobales bacterium]